MTREDTILGPARDAVRPSATALVPGQAAGGGVHLRHRAYYCAGRAPSDLDFGTRGALTPSAARRTPRRAATGWTTRTPAT
ncbi:hypothetical protein HBB16_07920 [Pseudonocardia sp. MCCB 268]|nr:hypothetical protein [Pseudonocardia cytotoxica]